jgi:hypothetical protein
MELNEAIEEIKRTIRAILQESDIAKLIGYGCIIVKVHHGEIKQLEISLTDRPQNENDK